LSNGPGDPTYATEAVYHLRKLMDSAPQLPMYVFITINGRLLT
jgi:carbamoylphosphate synthase small subunit